MKYAEKYARLPELTGFPNLANVNDPERLERLVAAAQSSLAHSTIQCPLRYKIAYIEYGEAAQYRLSQYRLDHPEEIE